MKQLYFILIELFMTNHNGIESVNGKFRVVYGCGRKSQRMYLHTAENYCKIFKGKVVIYKD